MHKRSISNAWLHLASPTEVSGGKKWPEHKNLAQILADSSVDASVCVRDPAALFPGGRGWRQKTLEYVLAQTHTGAVCRSAFKTLIKRGVVYIYCNAGHHRAPAIAVVVGEWLLCALGETARVYHTRDDRSGQPAQIVEEVTEHFWESLGWRDVSRLHMLSAMRPGGPWNIRLAREVPKSVDQDYDCCQKWLEHVLCQDNDFAALKTANVEIDLAKEAKVHEEVEQEGSPRQGDQGTWDQKAQERGDQEDAKAQVKNRRSWNQDEVVQEAAHSEGWSRLTRPRARGSGMNQEAWVTWTREESMHENEESWEQAAPKAKKRRVTRPATKGLADSSQSQESWDQEAWGKKPWGGKNPSWENWGQLPCNQAAGGQQDNGQFSFPSDRNGQECNEAAPARRQECNSRFKWGAAGGRHYKARYEILESIGVQPHAIDMVRNFRLEGEEASGLRGVVYKIDAILYKLQNKRISNPTAFVVSSVATCHHDLGLRPPVYVRNKLPPGAL